MPAGDWQGKNCLQIATRFRFPELPTTYLFLRSSQYEKAEKGKKNVWSSAEEKDFLLLCKEKQIADLLDKCVTSAGVSRSLFKYSL